MKKILTPVDFSKNAHHALQVAAALAQKTGARLEILHVNTTVAYAIPLPEYAGGDYFAMTDYGAVAAEGLHALKQELFTHPKYRDLKVDTRVEDGFLHATIRRVCWEDGVDLIVMGTKGASGVSEFLLGSNTEKVIRTAICPVLSVPEKATLPFVPKKVVFPSTLLPDQGQAFDALAKWQRLFPFEVHLVYLNNPSDFEEVRDLERHARKMAEKAGVEDLSVHINGNAFNEEVAILEFATQQGADLVVMGTHQRRGLSHLLFGSLTEDTTNHSHIPVLGVPLN